MIKVSYHPQEQKKFRCVPASSSPEEYNREVKFLERLGFKYRKMAQGFILPLCMNNILKFNLGRKQFPTLKFVCAPNFVPIYKKYSTDANTELVMYGKEIQLIKREREEFERGRICDLAGIDIDTPKYKLRNHQNFYLKIGVNVRRPAFFGDMGVGKTAPLLHTVAYRKKLKQIDKTIVTVPNSIKFKWAEGEGNEIEKHTNLTGVVLTGDYKKRFKIIDKFLSGPTDILVTSYNFWSGRTSGNTNSNDEQYKLLRESKLLNMYVCDESHKIKNPTSNAFINLHETLHESCKYGILMTGTPTPNTYCDIITQYQLLDDFIFGVDYNHTVKKYFFVNTESRFQQVTLKPELKIEFLSKINRKGLVASAEKCIDLPKKIVETISIEPSEEYLNEVNEITSNSSIGDNAITNINHISRLLTACSGFLYAKENDETVGIPFRINPKEEFMNDLMENTYNQGDKNIIWYSWKYDITMLQKMIKEKYPYILISQSDSAEDRIKKIKDFERNSSMPFLLTSPKITAEGVDIISARYATYYSLDFKTYDMLVQSEARNRRFGSIDFHKSITYYRLIIRNSVEERVLLAMDRKEGYKEALFGLMDYIKNNRIITAR